MHRVYQTVKINSLDGVNGIVCAVDAFLRDGA